MLHAIDASACPIPLSWLTMMVASRALPSHVKIMNPSSRCLSRQKYATAQAYKNEPTILSWNLINEPRCDNSPCATEMQAWISTQAEYLKSVDSNHLVTVGEPGT